MEKQLRGVATQRVKEVSTKFLGYEVNDDEVRLMAYIQYCLPNKYYVDRVKMRISEFDILKKWVEKGYLTENKDLSLAKKNSGTLFVRSFGLPILI